MSIHKRKKEKTSEKKYIKKILSLYFAVNLGMSGALCVWCGIQYAKKGTEKVWFGEAQSVITAEDIKNFTENIKQYLFFHINNDKIIN